MKIRKRVIMDKDTFAPILRYEVDFEVEPVMDSKVKTGKMDKDADDLMERLESFKPEMIESYDPTKLASLNPEDE